MPRMLFIGVGKMGLPMAEHLHVAYPNDALHVFDLSAERLHLAKSKGLSVLADSTQLFNQMGQSDVIFSSLPNDHALIEVGQWVAQHAKPQTVYVDTSTVSIDASAQVAQALLVAKLDYLRVSVSGNNHMAEQAQLTVMCSGSLSTYERLKPLFECWGKQHFYLGEQEQSRLMKLVVNLMIVQTSAMLAEGLTLGQRGGLDWSQMWQVISQSAVGSPIIKAKSAQLGLPIETRDFSPTFTVHQMLKDLSLMLDAAKQLQVPLMQTAMTQQWMMSALAHGDGQEDYASVIKVIERMAP